MRNHRPWAAIVAILTFALGTSAHGAEDIDLRPAQAAALEWLAAVDGGRYGETWDAAAPTFRAVIGREAWEKALVAAREPLGAALQRKLRSAQVSGSIPGSPSGEYVVIQFDAQFERRPGAVETITVTRQPDGSWKVAGYFLR